MEKIFDIAKDNEQSWGTLATAIDGNFEELSNEAQESNTASHISKIVSSSIMPTIIENKQVTVDGIRDASIQNYAEIDVSIFTDGILRVTAWTSTNAIVGYQWLDNDNNTTFVSTSEHGGGMYTYEIIVPQNATKLQFSFFKEHGISVDATYTARIPVNVEVAKMAPVISLAGMDGAVNTADSISNEELLITNYPRYVKREYTVSLNSKIKSFSEIAVGVGYLTTRGLYVIIDNTNIKVVMYINNTETVLATHAHNLTISAFINVLVDYKEDTIKYVINTFGGSYYGTDTEMGKKVYGDTDSIELNDIYGYSFVYANSETTLNDVELRRTNRGFREPVWIIGDSYCSTDNNERWPYYLLNEYKIKSWFLIALAGQTSNDLNGHVGAYNDLLNALQYGTPKYLWYQIQANDTNAVYEEYIYKIKDICDKRGITLILVRHAKLGEQVKGKDWQTKNSIALSLGLRYVDMYKAVTGNELTHDWYEGYLSSDGVHPTALGAKAEAMRILCDIPEITQYN